jgi:hypothetical protein
MLTETMWTVETVKEELPHINVRLPDGLIVRAEMNGRRMPVCGVWFEVHGLTIRYEAAWETVCRCLNEGRPLVV